MQLSKVLLISSLSVAGLIGCASKPSEIPAAHVSTAGYTSLSCTELHVNSRENINRINQLTREIDDKASGDSTAMAVGMVLFWPALFALDGDGPENGEYARLKGEINAMENVATTKECSEVLTTIDNYRENERLLIAQLAEEKKTKKKTRD